MADQTMNISFARVKEYAVRARDAVVDTNPGITVVLLQAAEADDTLRDYDTLSALLGATGNSEADFTNYTRKDITGADVTLTVDDTNNDFTLNLPDQTWNSAGGTTDNTLVKLLLVYDPDTSVSDDTTMVPLTQHDFSVTTDGSDLTAELGDVFIAS